MDEAGVFLGRRLQKKGDLTPMVELAAAPLVGRLNRALHHKVETAANLLKPWRCNKEEASERRWHMSGQSRCRIPGVSFVEFQNGADLPSIISTNGEDFDKDMLGGMWLSDQ